MGILIGVFCGLVLLQVTLVHSVPVGIENGIGGMFPSVTGGANPLSQGNVFGTTGFSTGQLNPFGGQQNSYGGLMNAQPNPLGGLMNAQQNPLGGFMSGKQSPLGGNLLGNNPQNGNKLIPNLEITSFTSGLSNGNGFMGSNSPISPLNGNKNPVTGSVSRHNSLNSITSNTSSNGRKKSNSNSRPRQNSNPLMAVPNALMQNAQAVPGIFAGTAGNFIVQNGQVLDFVANQMQNVGRTMQSYGQPINRNNCAIQ